MKTLVKHSLVLILVITSSCFSQNRYNIKQFGDETSEFIRQPIKWNVGDYGKLGVVLLSSYLVMHLDEDVRDIMLKDRSYYNSIPIETGRIWGEAYTTLIVSGLLAASGISNDNQSNKKIAFEIAQSGFYTASVTQLLKMSIDRDRPYLNNGAFNFSPFQKFDNDCWSLPSGHTSLAFSLSTILSQNSKSDLLKIAWYIPAVMTAFSRVYQDKHWTSDVLLGSAVGYFIAKWVTEKHRINENEELLNPAQLISFQIRL